MRGVNPVRTIAKLCVSIAQQIGESVLNGNQEREKRRDPHSATGSLSVVWR